jgi:lysophospholipase L1-like esterase
VVILLGINDCFSAPVEDASGVERRIDKMLTHADQLLDAIGKAAPKAQIGFCLTTPPNARQEAFEANYQDRYSRWGWKRIQHRLVQRELQYVVAKSDSRLSVVPTQLSIDPIDGYPANNGVHPNGNGYKQIGATIYSWLQAKLAESSWTETASLLKPFWRADVVEGEPVLFVRNNESAEAKGSLLFPIREVLSVRSSSGEITYEAGRDYRFAAGGRQIVIPTGSRVVTTLASQLRRPDGSQRHKLTHRDGNGEILFGGQLEYHQMQTSVTYKKAGNAWPVSMSSFDPKTLPVTIKKLGDRQDVSIVLLGDSISTGCNASGWGGGAPFQPAYQDLLAEQIEEHYGAKVKLTNLSVGGMATPWGVTMIDQVVSHHPDLVILAFGMNDSANRSAQEYGENTAAMIQATRKTLPKTEFILVASMLGNRDWVRLNHDVFPEYRDQLASLCETGIALADMTSVWTEFLNRKQDSDLTGNGVNHPNDFGHRVYAQVIASLLIESSGVGVFGRMPSVLAEAPIPQDVANQTNRVETEATENPSTAVRIAAHRGGYESDKADNAPENSVANIRNCQTKGYELYETDLQRTKDGHFVILHDATIERETTGTGPASEMTLADLKKLKKRFRDRSVSGHRVATLGEFLVEGKDRVVFKADLKPGVNQYFKGIIDVVVTHDAMDGIVFRVPYRDSKLYADYRSAGVPYTGDLLMFMVSKKQQIDDIKKQFDPSTIQVNIDKDDPTNPRTLELIRYAADQGMQVEVHAEGTEHDWQELIQAGARMFHTSKPAKMSVFLRAEGLRTQESNANR